ncbi:hypothetical protein CFOL_v3_22398, partial [Cephalotus follicularis]
NKEVFGHIGKAVKEARENLERIQEDAMNGDTVEAVKTASWKLNELLEREETLCKQRSRITWLREGDRSTAFFHSKATLRKKKNFIRGLMQEDGRWVRSEKDITNLATSYFIEIFTSQEPVGIEETDDPS